MNKKLMWICALCSFNAYAANQGTGMLPITSVTNWGSAGSEHLFIKLDEAAKTNPSGCTRLDMYELESGSSNVSRGMVLAAVAAGKPINMVIYGGGYSVNDRPKVVAVELK